jgi:DNA invertase Pin-like site-specific DNA recombinase
MGRGFMAMFSALAEDERGRIIKRTHEGRKVSQARGLRMGRKEKLKEKQKAEARQRLAAGEMPNDLAPLYGVSRATIARLRYSKERG